MLQRNSWIYLSLIGITIIALLPFWFGRFYGTGDMRDVYIPLELFFQGEVRAGHLPAWDPNAAWGFPVIAAAQIGFFYPPLAILRLTPIALYLPIVFILHLALSLFGMYFFMRFHKATPWASLISAVAFGLSAYVFEHVTHLNIFLAVSWLPSAMLLAAYIANQKKIRFAQLALFALLLGLPFLAGQLQMPLLIAIVTSISFAYQHISKTKKILPSIGAIMVVAVLVMAFTAIQSLPTLELVRYSSRGLTGTFDAQQANQHSFPLYHLITAIFPRFFGNAAEYWGKRLEIEYGFFVGTLPLLLAVFAATKKFRQHTFFIVLAIVSFLLALGELSPVRLLGIEPSLWFFSAPARWLLFTTFATAALAGFGFDLLKDHISVFKKFSTVVAGIVIGGTLITNGILWLLPESTPNLLYSFIRSNIPGAVASRPADYYINKFDDLLSITRSSSVSLASPYTLLPIVMLGATPILLKRRQGLKILTMMTILELLIVAGTTSPTVSWSTLLNSPATISQLPANVLNNQARIISVRSQGDSGKYFTNPSSNANDAVRAEQRSLLVPLIHSQFGIAGVEWPASLDFSKQSAVIASLRSSEGYTISDVAKARSLNIESILSPAREGILIQNIGAAPRASLETPEGTKPASYKQITPSKIELTTNSSSAGNLVVRDSWYPGWQATIDGRAATIKPVEGIFRGIDIPAGQHIVTMKYSPDTLYLGMAISIATLIIIVAAQAAYLIRL